MASNPFAALDSDDEGPAPAPVVRKKAETKTAPSRKSKSTKKTGRDDKKRNDRKPAGRGGRGRGSGSRGGRGGSRGGRGRDRGDRRFDRDRERAPFRREGAVDRERNRERTQARRTDRRNGAGERDRRSRNSYRDARPDGVKKGGAGNNNWGKADENLEDTVASEGAADSEDVKVEEKEEKEPEVSQLSLEEYMAKAAERRKGAGFAAKKERVVDESAFSGMKKHRYVHSGGNVLAGVGGDFKVGKNHRGKHGGANKGKHHGAKAVNAGTLINFKSPPPPVVYDPKGKGGSRRGKGGRGGDRRGGRGRGGKGERRSTTAAPNVQNASDFPPLGA